MSTKTLKKVLLAGTAIVAVSAFSTGAFAQTDITSTTSGTPTTIAAGAVTNATRQGATEFGAADANGGLTLTTITSGVDDANTNEVTTIRFYDSNAATADTLTVSGAVTVTQDGTGSETDVLLFEIGNGPASGANTNAMTVDFDGAMVAGANGQINITFANDTNADTVIFSNAAVNLGLGADGLANGANSGTVTMNNAADVTRFDGAAAQTFTGNIVGAGAGEGIVEIVNANGTGVTFGADMLGTNLANIAVGTATANGIADFDGVLAGAKVTVNGVTGNSQATFSNAVNTTAIELNSNGSNTATAVFDGATSRAIASTIDGAAAGEGTISVINTNAAGAVFNGAVGGTNAVGAINVGDGTTAGFADFNAAVVANAATVNATGGNSELFIGGNTWNAPITLTDGGNTARLTFNGGAAQTITGAVNGNAANSGTIDVENVNGTGVTFASAIGGTQAVEALNVGTTTAAGDAVFSSSVNAQGISVNANQGAVIADFNGAVTAGSNNFTVTDGNAGNAATANVAGNVTGNIVLDAQAGGGSAILNLDGSSAQVVSGTVTVSDTTGAANLVVGTGTGTDVTFRSAIDGGAAALDAFTITDGNTARFDDNNAANNALAVEATAFNNAGTLVVNDSLNFQAGTYDLASDAAAAITLGSAFDGNGTDVALSAQASGGTVDLTGNLTVTVAPIFNSGSVTLVQDDNGGSVTTNVGNITVTENAFATFAAAVANTNDVVITATGKTAAQTATALGVNSVDGSRLSTVADVNVAAVQNALQTATTVATLGSATAAEVAAAEAAADQAVSDASAVSGGVSEGASASVRSSSASIGSRLASLRNGNRFASNENAGLAAGDAFSNGNFWLRGAATYIDQDEVDGIDGYEADGYTLTAGVDTMVADDLTLGVALSYGSSEVDGDSAANSNTDIDSYGLQLYGNYDLENYYVSGLVGYSNHDADVSQSVLGFTGRGTGSFDTDSYNVAVEVGTSYAVGENSRIVPSVGFEYINLQGEDYVLNDSGSALSTNESISDRDIFLGKLGARYEAEYAMDQGVLMPEVHAGLLYDFASEESEASRVYSGSTVTISDQSADAEELAVNLGLGLAYQTNDGMTQVSAGYDAEIKSDYLAHTGQVKVKFKF
jgi:uncharacterized protein with beta-barrel porin domain